VKSLVSAAQLGRADLERIIERAIGFADSGHSWDPTLRGWTLATLFFEPSTRTRLSFELAARRLGADVVSFDLSGSAAVKGESERDTVLTVAAMGAQVLVVRHATDGFPTKVAEWTHRAVVNAGDGQNEHPTQALLDAVTLQRRFGRVEGLTVAIVGDIAHSRVANSLMTVLPALGANLVLAGPSEWLPDSPFPLAGTLDEVVVAADVVYLLRVQRERGAEPAEGYHAEWGLDARRAAAMRPEAVVMHPGPINRGVEVSDEVADGPRSLILQQVANGVPTRMSVLAEIGEAL
jgi:aspartate carbamoyltransferase catalytic subunit